MMGSSLPPLLKLSSIDGLIAFNIYAKKGCFFLSTPHCSPHPCVPVCAECKFHCTNGNCLRLGSLICNQLNNCGDNSDEENCPVVTQHPPPGIFNCKCCRMLLHLGTPICYRTQETYTKSFFFLLFMVFFLIFLLCCCIIVSSADSSRQSPGDRYMLSFCTIYSTYA
ncbi:hypothetical protein ILYODFUR_031865 [Ilyodon furcidens]|uniref:Uncharacterized protein n=1 Tax=Ilyodon furcidens TaxID=33524 RepID=A0ABV0UWY5_9TELE